MAQYPDCIYKIETGKNIKKYTHVCFSNLPYDFNTKVKVKNISYVCRVDDELTLDHVNFYLNFIEQFLNKKNYTYRIFNFSTHKKFKIKILFNLDCSKMDRTRALFYLTTFRYCQEFSFIVKELFNNKEKLKETKELFDKFQEIHQLIVLGKIKDKYYSLGGHGLLYPYGNAKTFKPIDIQKIKEKLESAPNFKSNNYEGVQGFFTEKA